MPLSRLFPVLLVLLQSGLAAGHAHAHAGFAAHTEAPHLHAHELLDAFTHEHDEHEHDGDDHDADAVDLSDVTLVGAPPTPGTPALELAPVGAGFAFAGFSDPSPAPLGLPPATAGPSTPRYITFCSLTI